MTDIFLGLQLMEYGLGGVFLVLILFYAMIAVMMKVLPYKDENKEN
jgi:Na+-transporting methylmalonyl-CoA/oxaloacetate decarboxylase gamma subunit